MITTAINYCNGRPHIGHAYEVVLADIIAKIENRKLVTGSDEHGMKIFKTAEKNLKTPKEQCDICVEDFKKMNDMLDVKIHEYIRTSSDKHKINVDSMWKRCRKDIYLDNYEGYYNLKEESFVTTSEAKKNNFLDDAGNDLVLIKEECYFFDIKKYLPKVKEWIATLNIKYFLDIPETNLCISRKRAPLNDLIVPDDPEHIIYVWFDALVSYMVTGMENTVHVIGKDIMKFHLVYWPAMLLSAGQALPKNVLIHGFIVDENGKKMSKSVGNVIDPFDLDLTSVEKRNALRLFFASSDIDKDVKFSKTYVIDNYNSFVDTVGNLINRINKIGEKLGLKEIDEVKQHTLDDFKTIMDRCRHINKRITDGRLWERKTEEIEEYYSEVIDYVNYFSSIVTFNASGCVPLNKIPVK